MGKIRRRYQNRILTDLELAPSPAPPPAPSSGIPVPNLSVKTLAAILVLAIAAVYANTLSTPFVFDDIPELVHNPDVLRIGDCWNTVSSSQNTGLSGRPFACLTFAANVAIDGFNVRGFHLVNILIHVLAALVLFGVVRRTLLLSGNNRPWVAPASFLVALAWGLHPLQTESVTYVIQRIESLAALLYLLTLYGAIRARVSNHVLFWSVISVISCALGMLTKETVSTAPVVVLLYDAVFSAGAPIFKKRAGLYFALAATWTIPIWLISQSPRSATVGFDLGVSSIDYLRTQTGVLAHYLWLCVWPHPQAISYSDWPIVREWGPAIAPGIVIVALLIAFAVGAARKKWWGFCGLAMFLILAPSSSFVPIVTEPAAERRMYLPLACFICLVLFGAVSVVRRFAHAKKVQPEIIAVIGIALIVLIVGALGTKTFVRNGQYASATGLFSVDVAARPDDELMRGALMDELIAEKRLEEARSVYETGIERNSDTYLLHDNWARSMLSLSRYEEAIDTFSLALDAYPDYAPSRAGLGLALLAQGQIEEAAAELREAVRISPQSPSYRANYAVALARLDRVDEAIAELLTAVEIKPNFSDGHFNLAQLLLGQGKPAEALEHLRIAARLRPGDQQIQELLDKVLRESDGKRGASPP